MQINQKSFQKIYTMYKTIIYNLIGVKNCLIKFNEILFELNDCEIKQANYYQQEILKSKIKFESNDKKLGSLRNSLKILRQ